MVKILKPFEMDKEEFHDFISKQSDKTQREIYQDICRNVALYATIAQSFEHSFEDDVQNLYNAGVDKLHYELGTLAFNIFSTEYHEHDKLTNLYYKALDKKIVLYPLANVFGLVPSKTPKAYDNTAFHTADEQIAEPEDEDNLATA